MINNSKLLYFLSFMLMFTIGCEDEEVADNDSETTALETPAEFVFESRLLKFAPVPQLFLICSYFLNPCCENYFFCSRSDLIDQILKSFV